MNEAEGTQTHWSHEVFQPWAPQGLPAQKLVWIASLVSLNRQQFARWPFFATQERPLIVGFAARCPFATFAKWRQPTVGLAALCPYAISSVARRLIFRWFANNFQVIVIIVWLVTQAKSFTE